MNKADFIKYATDYLALGYSIIPVGNNKKPLIKWEKYQHEKPSKSDIEYWANDYKDLNIAIVTGEISGLVVVDVEAGGVTDNLPPTVMARSGGGGFHFYYQYSAPVNNAVRIKDKVDIRGNGGYCVAPPSKHPSGNYYKWIQPPETTKLAKLPDWILKPNGDEHKPKINWKEVISAENPQGVRNLTATPLVGKLCHELSPELWENTIIPALREWNQIKNKPSLPDKELISIYKSISQKELAKQKSASGTETPQGIDKQPLLATNIAYQDVEDKVKALLPNSSTALKIILAIAIAANYKNSVMLWMLLVGVPSSGKTDMVRLIKDAEITYYLDNLTQNAFISGERASGRNKVHDLLPLIDKKCLIIKDWTSIFSLDEKMTKKLLGDLVGIYDKEFTKFSSRRGNVSYLSEFSQLGCITPATLNRHTNYMNMVGPRFLCFTMPTVTEAEGEQSYNIIFSSQDRSVIEKEARLYTSSYLQQLTQVPFTIKAFTPRVRKYIQTAAELMSNSRGIVILQAATFKNEDGEEVKYYEVLDTQVEEPWRAVQQLIHLSKYLAFVMGKDEVGVDELAIIKEVVISSMPADRSQALRSIKEKGGEITAKELADLSEKSSKTSRRLLEELFALKVLEKIKGMGTIATDYKLREKFKDFILLNPTEFMSPYSNEENQESNSESTASTEPSEPDGQTQINISSIPGLEDYGK